MAAWEHLKRRYNNAVQGPRVAASVKVQAWTGTHVCLLFEGVARERPGGGTRRRRPERRKLLRLREQRSCCQPNVTAETAANWLCARSAPPYEKAISGIVGSPLHPVSARVGRAEPAKVGPGAQFEDAS